VSEWDIIPPPSNMTVTHEHKPILYLPDGRVLVRQAGFRVGERRDMPKLLEATGEVSSPRRTSTQR
jgi:hypothetical protein